MKKIYKNIILFINGISKKTLLITKIVNIVKFSVDSTMPEYVLTVVPDKFESELVDNSLLKSMKRVCSKYMDWDLSEQCTELEIIEQLKKLDKDKRTSFWILLAAEINISVSKNNIHLEHAIIETQKAYSFLKKK
jgi:hypothetical protein